MTQAVVSLHACSAEVNAIKQLLVVVVFIMFGSMQNQQHGTEMSSPNNYLKASLSRTRLGSSAWTGAAQISAHASGESLRVF